MGLIAYVKPATGRSRCLVCRNVIEKGQKQIIVEGYRTGGRIHSNPYQCNLGARLQWTGEKY